MGQFAKRFDAVGARKGTALHEVVGKLKELGDFIEEHFEPGSLYVTNAAQRFEMGLNQLSMAPEREQAPEAKKAPARRKKAADTPGDEDGESTEDAS